MKNRKTKKAIDFIGPSVEDLGLTLEAKPLTPGTEEAERDNAHAALAEPEQITASSADNERENGESMNADQEKPVKKTAVRKTSKNIKSVEIGNREDESKAILNKGNNIKAGGNKNKIGQTEDSADSAGNAKKPHAKNPDNLYRRAIREYLERALGDQESVEIKISQMQQDLGISIITVYKHLGVLRKTDYEIKKLQFSTLLKRKTGKS
jgi:hypothetical protein